MKIETKEVRFSLEELQIKRADIDKKVFRPYLRQIANGIRKSARKKASQKKVSARGEYPGKRSGALAKAIRVRYFKSGYGFRWQFYPAFLRFGVKRRKKGQKLDSWRIEKRRDYINDAALEHEQGAMDVVMQGLDAALKGMFAK